MKKVMRLKFFILLMFITYIIFQGAFLSQSVYADSRPTLIIGDDVNYPPYSYVDANGNYTGLNVELARAAGEAMGYNVEIRLDKWSEIRNALENGEIDAISGMFYSQEREKVYDFTVKHSVTNGDVFTRNGFVISKLEDLRNKTVVVQKGDIIAEFLASQELNIKLVEVPTVKQALKLVENGEYDYAAVLKVPGLYVIRQEPLLGLKEQGIILYPNEYCMAVKKENDDVLMILDGGMQIIKASGEYQEIYDKWLGVYEDKDLVDYIKENKIWFLLILLVLFGLTILSVILKYMVSVKTQELAKNMKEIEYISYHDHLTGLHNRRFFESELKRLDTKQNLPLCIIMGDVNGLKLVNDSFGHKKGDELLIKVAEVLNKACSSKDIISRIGGDEFVILIPKVEKFYPEKLIERVNKISENYKIESIDLSISFGWEVKTDENEDIQEVLNSAENYMYKKKLFEGPSVRGKTIGAIINTLHEKNKREEQHSKRVSELCKSLALALDFSERKVEEVKTVGLLHDIGKIAINEDILNSTKRLTDEEYAEIKRHPEVGYRILKAVNDMNEIAEFVLYHHERWDGNGYPTRLKGEDIPLEARMICIADAYDAMTSDRSYRNAGSKEFAISELRRNAGSQFDPDLVELFIKEVLKSE